MRSDVLIVGSGIAGATAALRLAQDRERQVTVLTRGEDPDDSNSTWAQGGIVGRGVGDTPEILAQDVLNAGAGLSHAPAVRLLAEEGPRLLQEILIDGCGIEFDRGPGDEPTFGLEGAHSKRRILHVGDSTGRAIMRGLLARIAELPNVRVLTRRTAVDLLTFPHHASDPLAIYDGPCCHGVYALNQESGEVDKLVARHTILATGGLGQVFLNTTNPTGSRGDGLAMAYRAGARVINTEFVQFHPTALHMPGTRKLLISEAVRGEGARLLTPDGDRFMARHAPAEQELATRDVVARAIYTEMLAHDFPYVLLDIASHRDPSFIRGRFPQIHEECLRHNIDVTTQPIPVVPAAHYSCGGVQVDLDGRTTIDGLYAIGEVSCTGVHGANRLASTSLLEGLVWADRATRHIRDCETPRLIEEDEAPAWDESKLAYESDPALIQGDMQTIRNLMWHYVGLLRSGYRLKRASRELRHLLQNIEEFYRRTFLSDALIGLRNAVLCALIVARAAAQNPASRGCHYREDSHPSAGAVPPATG